MANHPTRRDLLASVPAAAWLGAGLSSAGYAQGVDQPGQPTGSLVQKMLADCYQDNLYTLPSLPYPADALEPYLTAKIVQSHHDVLEQLAVNGLNKAIQQLGELTAGGDEIDGDRLAGLERDLSFYSGGLFLHTIYWATMGGGQGGEPIGEIAEAITAQFGTPEVFKKYFSKVAVGVKGSGWAVLSYEPIGDRLCVQQVSDYDMYIIPGAQALLPCDVWEHAYYLKYGPGRAEYVQAWWHLVNWNVVNESYKWMRARRREGIMTTTGR